MLDKLNPNQRRMYAEKLTELGNLSYVGLVLAQLLSEEKSNIIASVIGLVLLCSTYGIAFFITKGGDHDF